MGHNDENRAEQRTLRLSVTDLHIIHRAPYSYRNELRRNDSPLPTTNELHKGIETICERIAVVIMPRASRTPNDFGLSSEEFAIVDRALTAYVVSIGQSIPPSEERDEILRGCEALRIQILAHEGEGRSETHK